MTNPHCNKLHSPKFGSYLDSKSPSAIVNHWNKSLPRSLLLIVFCCSASIAFGAVPKARSSYRIPFELTNNLVVLQGSINNSKPLFLLLDTGASGSVINESRAKELG